MSRYYGGTFEENQPVTWVRGYPIYAAHLIVAVLASAMIVTTIFLNRQAAFWLRELPFNSTAVLSGDVWRVFSYGLVQAPDIWRVIDYVMLVWFGREVERNIGRKSFFWVYGWAYLLPTIVLSLLGFIYPSSLSGGTGALAMFIAFATLYPGAPLMFNLLAKWAAFILLGIYTLMHLAYHHYAGLIAMWTSCGAAFVFIRHYQGLLVLPQFSLWKRKPRLRVLPDAEPRRPVRSEKSASTAVAKTDAMAEVDALLDKIAKSGIGSLTAKERAKLEAAREGLLKRGAGRD